VEDHGAAPVYHSALNMTARQKVSEENYYSQERILIYFLVCSAQVWRDPGMTLERPDMW